MLIGDACHDYEVVKKVKVSAHKTWLRVSSLRGSKINGEEEGEEGRDDDWSSERFGGNTIEMENPMEAARKRRGNKSKAKVQNQGKITKKKKKRKKKKKEEEEEEEEEEAEAEAEAEAEGEGEGEGKGKGEGKGEGERGIFI